jgi:hypothetical protein
MKTDRPKDRRANRVSDIEGEVQPRLVELIEGDAVELRHDLEMISSFGSIGRSEDGQVGVKTQDPARTVDS